MTRIAVIGAGVTGITTAYQLLKNGHEVCVFDTHDGAAMETSFANGGQVSVSNAEVWNNWPSIRKALSAAFDRNAPVHIHPLPDWHKISWFAAFLAAGFQHRRNTAELAAMAMHGRSALREIAARENIAFDMNECGLLHVYKTPKQFAAAAQANELLTQSGLKRYAVTKDEIKSIEPALQGDFYAGLFSPDDFAGDVHLFTRGLYDVCRTLGMRACLEHDVLALEANGNGIHVHHRNVTAPANAKPAVAVFDKIVVCAGVGSRRLARMLGDRVNVYPVKGYSLSVDIDLSDAPDAAPNVCLLDEDAKIVTSRLANRLRIAGLAEFNGADITIDARRIGILSNWCRARFPDLAQENTTPWAGLRPMMPRMVPRVGRGRLPGVYYNTGHGHLGWTLSAGTAQRIAEIIDADAP